MKKIDMIVIAVILLIAVLWLALSPWSESASATRLSAEIYQDGELTHKFDLTDDEWELKLESVTGYNVMQVGPHGIRVLEADCHNQDCFRAGLQGRPGGVIACLPHHLLILIIGEKEDAFDAIVR